MVVDDIANVEDKEEDEEDKLHEPSKFKRLSLVRINKNHARLGKLDLLTSTEIAMGRALSRLWVTPSRTVKTNNDMPPSVKE
jgi:hypothetical protein